MMDVKRYDAGPGVNERTNGRYVTFDAHQQEVERLRRMMDHSCGTCGFVVYGTAQSTAAVERRLAAAAELAAAVESLIGVIDGVGVSFKNGVTDSTGTIDEGEVYASRALAAVELALLRVRNEQKA